jgi:hypothetical protein
MPLRLPGSSLRTGFSACRPNGTRQGPRVLDEKAANALIIRHKYLARR